MKDIRKERTKEWKKKEWKKEWKRLDTKNHKKEVSLGMNKKFCLKKKQRTAWTDEEKWRNEKKNEWFCLFG